MITLLFVCMVIAFPLSGEIALRAIAVGVIFDIALSQMYTLKNGKA